MIEAIEIELTSLLCLIILDTVIGILIAIQIKTFSFNKLVKALYKILIYGLLIMSSFLVDTILLNTLYEQYYITITLLFSLSILELFSIFGNLSNTGVPIPKIDFMLKYIGKDKNTLDLGSEIVKNISIDKDLNLLINKYLNSINNEEKKKFLSIVFNTYKKNIINRIVSDLTGLDNKVMEIKLKLFVTESNDKIRFVVSRDSNLNKYYSLVSDISFDFNEILNKKLLIQKKKDLLVERVIEKMYIIFDKIK